MLNDTEVEKIASLARIKLDDKEKESLKKDLSSILDYVKKLDEADTSDVEPLYHPPATPPATPPAGGWRSGPGIVNATRPDEPRGEFVMDEKLNEKLIGQAPHQENRFIKVKSVFDRK